MKKLLLSAALAVLPLMVAAESAPLDGEALYKSKTCFTCHGKDAKNPIMPVYPKLAGQNKEYALQQMKDIKEGTRANGMSAAMRGVMHLVNDEEMVAIAEWLATQ
jgi:cytochrome c